MKSKTISMFLATYEYGTITQAAEEMFLSKQTVSRTLKVLEKELGVKLFRKIKDGSEPTDECHRVYRIMKELKGNIDDIEEYYKIKHNPYSVRIADNNVEIITRFYNMALQKYGDKNVMYSFENIDGHEIYDRLISKMCDIGVFPIPKTIEREIKEGCKANNIELELLLETGPSIIVNNTHPLSQLKEIRAEALKPFKRVDLIRNNEKLWFFNKYLEEINLNTVADIRTNSVANAVSSIKDTECYFISAYFENDMKYLSNLKMIPLKDTGLEILLFLGYNKGHLYDNGAKHFMELVRRHYRGEEIEG